MTVQTQLPPLLAGPILRHVSSEHIVVWLVSATPDPLHLSCWQGETILAEARFESGHAGHVPLAQHAHLHLLQLNTDKAFPLDSWLSYDLGIEQDSHIQWLRDTLPHILYEGEQRPSFVIKEQIDQLLHGSCRKPHHPEQDALLEVDKALEAAYTQDNLSLQPALLLLTGDQVYMDDVAGSMLAAIQQIIQQLDFREEVLEFRGKQLGSSTDLYRSDKNFYKRPSILPDTSSNNKLQERFFQGARKPIFTSASADNHLITLGEVITMYLLAWSSTLWELVDLEQVELPAELQKRYQAELPAIQQFAASMPQAQRALAHVPVYMIFDDHDVTDDWNLTRAWEETAYGHTLSRRIIGNALIGYFLCQGWGNAPDTFPESFVQLARTVFNKPDEKQHDKLIDTLLKFEEWQYTVATTPPLIVLDTRTRRWRSERNAAQPSGLMDWEALSETQQALINHQAVIMVSPAPVFGVKLIEATQRVFTWFGMALTVDAENWMAHPGSANVILNIFRHRRTPHNFVILSGDVHYSFVYDVRLRDSEETPHIWQITSSGVQNAFPTTLLRVFDRLNRWLFARYSPLIWFTRRRHFSIRQRRPGEHQNRYRHQRLLNGSGIGRVWLDQDGAPIEIEELLVTQEVVPFKEGYDWDWIE